MRPTRATTRTQRLTFAELGTALDHLGKRDAAFAAYRKAFGGPVPVTLSIQHEGPDVVEAFARYGVLCEDRGLRRDAVQCFDGAVPAGLGPLYGSLNAATAPPALVRALLGDVRGAVLEEQARFGKERSAEALSAFRDGVRLAPGDPRPYLFLADGLRRAGRFAQAQAALRKVTKLDTSGALSLCAEQALESIWARRRD